MQSIIRLIKSRFSFPGPLESPDPGIYRHYKGNLY